MLDRREHGGSILAVSRLPDQPRQGLVDGLQIGEDELGIDGLDVILGRDLPVHVHDVRVGERSDNLADRIRFADVRQELVA